MNYLHKQKIKTNKNLEKKNYFFYFVFLRNLIKKTKQIWKSKFEIIEIKYT